MAIRITKMKKILIAIPSLLATGGEERLALKIAQHFGILNVEIITNKYNPLDTYPEFQDFEIKTFSKSINRGNFLINQVLSIYRFLKYKNTSKDSIIIALGFPSHFVAFRNKNMIWYCNTPYRLLYDLKDNYIKALSVFKRPIAYLYTAILRLIDLTIVKKIPLIIANSINVATRIANCYGKNSKVIYPGCDIKENKDMVFNKILLCVSRLYLEKRVSVVVSAMKFLPDYTLFVVGDGPEKQKLLNMASTNAKIVGRLSDEELNDLYDACFCTIYIPEQEDFGLIPIESNAHGKMCIGIREGGLAETIIDYKTGVFIFYPTPEEISCAVRSIERIDPKTMVIDCIENAKKFSWDRFCKRIEEVVNEENN